MNNNYELYNDDCLKIMDELIERGIKVDAIITDPPYGTTQCKWDTIIPFDEMWNRLEKLIKPNGAIVLFGSEPFSSHLRISNIKLYKYDWYWLKDNSKATNFTHAKNMPLKNVETISIFSNGSIAHKNNINRMIYNPQGLIPYNKVVKGDNKGGKNNEHALNRASHKSKYIREYTNYPNVVLNFKTDWSKQLHPTQKPVTLLEYLIKTYTSEGETVLDFTMGSGSTGVACMNTNRRFIGIELEKRYFDIAKERMENTIVEKEVTDTKVI